MLLLNCYYLAVGMESLRREQIVLSEHCAEEIEEVELALWQSRAELDDLQLQYAGAEEQLVAAERLCTQHLYRTKTLTGRLGALGAGFTESQSSDLLKENTLLMRKVGAAVCSLAGFQECSWQYFTRLLREYKQLVDALEHFEHSLVDPATLASVQLLLIEEQLHMQAESGLLPAALKVLVDWLLAATDLVQVVRALHTCLLQLPSLATAKNEAYIVIEEMQDRIAELERRLLELSQLSAVGRNSPRSEEELEDMFTLLKSNFPQITSHSLLRGQVLPVEGPADPSLTCSEAVNEEETPNKPVKSRRTRCCGLRKSA